MTKKCLLIVIVFLDINDETTFLLSITASILTSAWMRISWIYSDPNIYKNFRKAKSD